MKISLSLPKDLVDRIRAEAERNHRNISGQFAFFCEQGLSTQHKPKPENKTSTAVLQDNDD